MKRYHVIVEGQVQGVGFRGFAMLNAQRRHLTGSVKNLENGKILFDGKEPSQVYLYQQNSNGRITSAEISFTMPKGYEFDQSKITVTQ